MIESLAMTESTAKPVRKRTKKPAPESAPTAETPAPAAPAPEAPAEASAPELAAPEPAPEPIEPPTPFAWEAPPGFEPVPQDFLLFVPDRAQGRAILGILVDEIELPRDRSTGRALVLVLLEPAPLVTAEGTIVEGRPGQEVLVEVTHFLRRLVRAARDRESVGELWLRPIGRMRADGGDSLTLWDIRHGKTFPRASVRRGGAR